METKYNGWYNYATWRINLEIIDGSADLLKEQGGFRDIGDLKVFLREYVEDAITLPDNCGNTLTESYAMAFISDVNYHEIAEHLIEDYPELIIQ